MTKKTKKKTQKTHIRPQQTAYESAKNKAKLEYISEGQPSPLKLAFEVELGLNSF